jgi:hypothetical protein
MISGVFKKNGRIAFYENLRKLSLSKIFVPNTKTIKGLFF